MTSDREVAAAGEAAEVRPDVSAALAAQAGGQVRRHAGLCRVLRYRFTMT